MLSHPLTKSETVGAASLVTADIGEVCDDALTEDGTTKAWLDSWTAGGDGLRVVPAPTRNPRVAVSATTMPSASPRQTVLFMSITPVAQFDECLNYSTHSCGSTGARGPIRPWVLSSVYTPPAGRPGQRI